jgi:hypothetical protein
MYSFTALSTSNSPGTSPILVSNTAFSQRESLPCQRNQRVLPRSQPPKHPNSPRGFPLVRRTSQWSHRDAHHYFRINGRVCHQGINLPAHRPLQLMTINLTRFYIDTEIKGADFKYRVIEDIETVEADEFEAKLKEENLPYLRTDL